MKKLIFYLMIIVVSLSAFPNTINAAEKNPNTAANNPKEMPAEVKSMLTRLDEIKAMDKSSLNFSEKKRFVKRFELLMLN